MPVATIDPNASERFELKSAPGEASAEDVLDQPGFVVLRALPYGMKLTRRDKATKMMMRSQPTQKGNTGGDAESTIELESYNEWAVAYDFANCILDHNLCDFNKVKLDFKRAIAIKMLDPKVGTEIEKLINSLNEDEDEAMLDDFLPQLNSSSTDDKNTLLENGDATTETANKTS